VAAASLFMLLQIGKNLVFCTIKENIYYFTGFFSIALTFASLSLAEALEISNELPLVLVIAITSASTGYHLITKRVAKIKKEMDETRDPHILALCLELLHT